MRSLRLARYTMTAPENGSSPSASCARAASVCAPLRKSTGRMASKMRTPAGTLITFGRRGPDRAQHRRQLGAIIDAGHAHDGTGKLDLDDRPYCGSDALRDAGAGASAMIGTKSTLAGMADLAQASEPSCRASRRHPNTCCGHNCQRRATSATRAPGSSVSATIAAFSSADQRRRRRGPVKTSTRRKLPFASSLTSNITMARSPLPQARPA
jgi:hypothetical protein